MVVEGIQDSTSSVSYGRDCGSELEKIEYIVRLLLKQFSQGGTRGLSVVWSGKVDRASKVNEKK